MSDLLKQAIADAKAVRATALSNAKAALEEHFAPKLQSMLSEKLAAEMAEEGAPEAHADAEQDAAALAASAPADAAPADAAPVDAAPADAAPADAAQADAAQADAAPDEEPAPAVEEEIEEIDLGDLDEESMEEVLGSGNPNPVEKSAALEEAKASSNYKTKTKGHKTDNKGQEVKDATKLSTPGTGGKSVATKRTAADKYDGAGTQQKGGPVKDMHNKAPKTDNKGQEIEQAVDLDTPALNESDAELDEASLDEILNELEAGLNEVGMDELSHAPAASDETPDAVDEEVNLEEILSEDDDAKKGKEGDDENENAEEEVVKENISLKKELAEYRSAVVYLRDRINEVNLLNAKLLYTNKLFKQASLNNEQKLKVIESFDLTKSVREAKLVYATLAESFSFGGNKTVETAKKPASATVKTITEGLASKPVASTKPTKAAVLTEGAEMANRFKKLAGIRS